MGRQVVSWGLLGLLAFSTLAVCSIASETLEGLDLEDLDAEIKVSSGSTEGVFQKDSSDQLAADLVKARQQAKPRAPVETRRRALASAPQGPKNYYMEAAAGVVLVLYIIVAIFGTRKNDHLAQAFAKQHCVSPDSIFPRQFALCGAGDPGTNGVRSAVVKESSSTYKFYASGRRYCQGCLATLLLQNRADLMSWLLSVFLPSEDLVEVEVYMNEGNMPPMVLAVGTPRQAARLGERSDVKAYAKSLKVSASGGSAGDGVPSWNNAKLSVLAEHSSLFYELFSDPRVHGIFTSPAHADKLRLFRSLLVTSENSEGSHKRLLRFTFALPAADDMKALGPLLALVPLLVDLVGVYKLSPDLKKKLVDARTKQEAAMAEAEEGRKKRIVELQKRKVEKMVEEKERISRLAPEARRKAEEKLAKQMAKKSQKVKMVRM